MKEKHDYLDEPILPPEKENELQEIKKIKAKETEQLVDKKKINESQKEKEYLIKILHEIENELTEEENKNKSITNIYSKIMNPDDDEELNIRKSIKENWDNCFYRVLLHFTFCILLPLFAIVNLVGIFQILSIQKILCKAFQKGVKIFLGFEKEDENYEFYNFYGYYIKESLDEGFDFNLMYIMNCIGFLSFKNLGFYWSSIIFLSINIVSLMITITFFNKYREPNDKYEFMELSTLLSSNLLLYIGAGAATLFSQTILIDNFYKYSQFLRMRRKEMKGTNQKELKESKNERKKKKKTEKIESNKKNSKLLYSIFIYFSNIGGYTLKYFLDIIISKKKYEFDSKYNLTDINTNITNTTFNTTENKTDYIIAAHNEIFKHDKDLFFKIFGAYVASIIISLIIYYFFTLIFEDNEKIEKNEKVKSSKMIYKICGYTIFRDGFTNQELDKINNYENNYEYKLNEIEEDVKEIKKGCLLNCILGLLNGIKLIFFSIKGCCDVILCRILCCLRPDAKCCCCCCIKDINDIEYYTHEHSFCYCYKGERNLNWFNKFAKNKIQIKILPIMLDFCILQLTTIGLEKVYNDINDEEYNNFKENKNILIYFIIFVISLLLFFYLSISLGTIINQFSYLRFTGLVERLSDRIITGSHGILIFNSFYSFILSIIYLLKGLDEKSNSFKNYILIPVFINKFYYFTFTLISFSVIEQEQSIEIISISLLIPIYSGIWNFIIGKMINYLPINVLFIIQIVFSSIVILITLFILFMFLFFFNMFWLTFLYLLSFVFAFGGFWFCKCFKNHNFYKKYRCCRYCTFCCSKGSCKQRCDECLECFFGEQIFDEFNKGIKENAKEYLI